MRLNREAQRFTAYTSPFKQACINSGPTPPLTAEELQVQAITEFQAGNQANAETILARASVAYPLSADIRNNLGTVLKSQSKVQLAAVQFQAALELDPNHAGAHANLGACLAARGDQQLALQHLLSAVKLNPRHVTAWMEMIAPLARLGRFQEALGALQTAASVDPAYASASAHDQLAQIAFAFLDWGRPAEAERFMREARALRVPGESTERRERAIFTDLGFHCQHAGRVVDALAWFERALEVDPADTIAHSHIQWCCQYLPDVSPSESAERARSWAATHAPVSLVRKLARRTAQDDRIRIGYVSPDFWDRPAAYCLESLISHHDRDRFEVYLYGNSLVFDQMTAALRRNSDFFRCINPMTDDEVCELVEYDKIDILIDLAGFTEGNRIGVFARKPAPIQAEWLGYYATTGLTQIDYFLCNPLFIPPEEEHLYTEKPVRLGGEAFSFDPPQEMIAIGDPPAKSNGFVTFGSSAYLAKVTAEVVEVWSAVLNAVPGSRLLMNRHALLDPVTRSRFQTMFAANGIDPSRLEFLSTTSRREYLEKLGAVDILLDTFPFNGGTSTYEALWMGLPVVTMVRPRMVGHFSESILSPLGHSDWVAHDKEQFVAIASRLASDFEELSRIRNRLRPELCASCLCDSEAFAGEVESAFLWMVEEQMGRAAA